MEEGRVQELHEAFDLRLVLSCAGVQRRMEGAKQLVRCHRIMVVIAMGRPCG